ncbi:MAG: thermostable hemolysin [Sedimenticolaceae bacterium]|jgi:hypothetical protein
MPLAQKPVLAPQVLMMSEGSVHRQSVEAMIAHDFEMHYQAQITSFMPTLMGLKKDHGAIVAALGLRDPISVGSYVEHYLDAAMEQMLSSALGQTVQRESLMEIGNFAVTEVGAGRWLITALTAVLASMSKQWAVFTCRPELRNAFKRLGVELVDLGEAHKSRLPIQDQQAWGRYYDKMPHVMAANVAQSGQALIKARAHDLALDQLWHNAEAYTLDAA